MKQSFCETILETGRRGELEQDKLFCLLLNMQEKIRRELEEDPDYHRSLELERLQSVTDEYRKYIRNGKDLFDRLIGWVQRTDPGADGEEADTESAEDAYPTDTLYHMAVAEQERDLHRLYPSKFGNE